MMDNGSFVPVSDPQNRNKADSIIPFLETTISNAKGVEAIYSMPVTFRSKKKYGRLTTVNKNVSYVTLHRPVRHFICEHLYDDNDLVNCHPVLLVELFKYYHMDKAVAYIDQWNQNRESYFKTIMEHAPNPITRDDCKRLGFTFMYEGSVHKRFLEFGYDFDVSNYHPSVQKVYGIAEKLCKFSIEVREKLKEEFHEVWNLLPRDEDKHVSRTDAGKFSTLMQHFEAKVMILIHDVAVQHGLKIGDLAYDGIFLEKTAPSTAYLEFYKDAEQQIKEQFGFNMKLVHKSMSIPEVFSDFQPKVSMSVSRYSEKYLRPLPNIPHIVIQSDYGTGKTHVCIEKIKETKPQSVLWLTCRIKFADSLLVRLHNNGLSQFQIYNKCPKGEISPTKFPFLVMQINSIHRLPCDFKYDLIICDEIESCTSMLSAPILTKRRSCVDTFQRLTRKANATIFGDGNISQRTWDLMAGLKLPRESTHFEHNTFMPRDMLACRVKNNKVLLWQIYQHLKEGKKICVFSSTTGFIMDKLIPMFKHEFPNDKYLVYLGKDKAKAFKELHDRDVDQIGDVEKDWADKNVRMVCYTPTITVGVDFNTPGVFDNIFFAGMNGLASPRTIMQAIHRIRKPISNKVYYSVYNMVFSNNPLYGINSKEELLNQLSSKRDLLKKYDVNDIHEDARERTWFKALNLHNLIEDVNTMNFFRDELSVSLRKAGYKLLSLDVDQEYDTSPLDKEVQKKSSEISFNDVRLIDEYEYDVNLKALKQGTETQNQYLEIMKYKFCNDPDMRWGNCPDLFPMMFSSSNRSRLRFMRAHLDNVTCSEYLDEKLTKDYISCITGRNILLDSAHDICGDLGMKNLIDNQRIAADKFQSPAQKVDFLKQSGVFAYGSDVNSDVGKVSSFFRYLSGLEFVADGQKKIKGQRVKVYTLDRDLRKKYNKP
jgi:hypothetical protein